MNGHFQTDQGQIRDHNEDAGGMFYNQSGQLLAIIADGMGGHQAGDVASQMVTSFVHRKWEETGNVDSAETAETWLKENLQEVNRTVLAYAQENEECTGMGTTAVAAVCTETFTAVAHIGDSRCYILSDGSFRQITEDHSLVNELVRSGQITKDDAEHHPRKNVLLKAIGTEMDIVADAQTIEWKPGDKLLLCSDGLTDKISDDELSSFLRENKDAEANCHQLVELANERGGEDNISLIIVHHEAAAKEGDAKC